MSGTTASTGPFRPEASILALSSEVRDALAAGRPVVALESSLVTHGLPRPRNLAVARAAEQRIRDEGAVPATVAVHDGCLAVGLSGAELERLATAEAAKASRQTLAGALVGGGWAGTTVSGTMIAAHLAGIRVFATGGVGGVHRGAGSHDVSADLEELARTPVAVVCAGPKAIVDVPATLEVLETRGVPVIAVATDEVPGFWTRSSGLPAPVVAADEARAASIVTRHWELGIGGGVLVCVPVPEEAALTREESEAAVARAQREAERDGRHGPALTPWLLARVAEITEGRSLAANEALILNDAAAGARLARALHELGGAGRDR